MKRVRLTATPTKRVRLQTEPAIPYDVLKKRYDDLRMQNEADTRYLSEVTKKVETLSHEIHTIQSGYRALIQKAEAAEARRVRRMVETEFEREVNSLRFQLTESRAETAKAVKHLDLQARGFYEDGPNHSCPECGCVIRPVPLAGGKPAKRLKAS